MDTLLCFLNNPPTPFLIPPSQRPEPLVPLIKKIYEVFMSSGIAFHFNPTKCWPMDVLAAPRNKVPPEGTLPRCRHSIYAPDKGKALSCEACFPLRPAFQRNVILPAKHMKDDSDMFANEPGRCPKCHERAHYVLKDGRWECAECATKYKGPKKRSVEESVEVAA
jgi:Transposase zinc-ribbon domain